MANTYPECCDGEFRHDSDCEHYDHDDIHAAILAKAVFTREDYEDLRNRYRYLKAETDAAAVIYAGPEPPVGPCICPTGGLRGPHHSHKCPFWAPRYQAEESGDD